MLVQPQTDLVEHFRSLRQSFSGSGGEIAPAVVDPYAAQLLHTEQLAFAVPALWVDVETAELEAETEGGDQFATEMALELIVCTVNQAGVGAGYSDGIALLSWAVSALLSAPLPVGNQKLRPVGVIRAARIATDERYYAARVTADLEIDSF
jgi:hypothetical protein